jgi:hypothetical protein
MMISKQLCPACKRLVNCNKRIGTICCECHGAGSYCLPGEHDREQEHKHDGQQHMKTVSGDMLFF